MSDTMPTVCHFCGSKVTILSDGSECKADDGSWIGFQCGTSWHKGYHNPRQLQSIPCEIDERDALKARIKRLEEAGKELRECASWVGHACCEYADQIRRAKAAVKAWDKEAKP